MIAGIDEGNSDYITVGSVVTVVGIAITGGGIYLNKKGHKQLRNIAAEYNYSQQQSYYNSQPRLNLLATGNGMGLRVTF